MTSAEVLNGAGQGVTARDAVIGLTAMTLVLGPILLLAWAAGRRYRGEDTGRVGPIAVIACIGLVVWFAVGASRSDDGTPEPADVTPAATHRPIAHHTHRPAPHATTSHSQRRTETTP
jgi:hypothetical protein